MDLLSITTCDIGMQIQEGRILHFRQDVAEWVRRAYAIPVVGRRPTFLPKTRAIRALKAWHIHACDMKPQNGGVCIVIDAVAILIVNSLNAIRVEQLNWNNEREDLLTRRSNERPRLDSDHLIAG